MKQSDLQNPIALAKIIAASNSNNIPVNASGSSYASQTEGFPEITMIPEEQGGEAPHGKDFNGFLRILTSHMFNIQNGTPETFNPEVSTLIGGYPKNAQLWLINSTTSRLLKSTKDDNTDNFLTTPSVIGTSWIDAFPTKDYVDTEDSNLQSQITTNANNISIKANNNAVVHLTGNETITGNKTFTGNVHLPFGTLLTKPGVAISGGTLQFEQPTDTSLKGNAFIDIYGNLMRFVGVNSSQNYTTPLSLDLETNVAIANASDAANSVVTTTGISKSENGFVRLGNGLIIQWGICSSGVQTNFPTPFTSVVKMCLSGIGQYGTTSSSIYSLTKTYFEARNSSGWSMNFIAIGY